MTTNYNNLIPKQILFNLKQIQEIGLIKVSMLKKIILNGEIEVVKIGNKLHVPRDVLVAYLENNTIHATN